MTGSIAKISILALFTAGLILGQPPAQPPAATTLAVTGDVPTPLTLSADDLAKLPRETVSVDDQDGTKVQYEGVPLREVMKRAGAPLGNQLRGKALASYVIAKARDGYQVVFGLGELDQAFANEQIIVADKRDGKSLFGYQGPFRLVCPNDHAGARSVRMLETLELVRLQK
jgi:DMSO/TMAO reductase YedYZ molybdopterin-dependent catalytic subunit